MLKTDGVFLFGIFLPMKPRICLYHFFFLICSHFFGVVFPIIFLHQTMGVTSSIPVLGGVEEPPCCGPLLW